MEQLEHELKHLIVETLMLEDVNPDQINADAPLFGEGLGLDSIDALELGMAISKKYKIQLKDEQGNTNREAFASVRALAEFVNRKQTEASA